MAQCGTQRQHRQLDRVQGMHMNEKCVGFLFAAYSPGPLHLPSSFDEPRANRPNTVIGEPLGFLAGVSIWTVPWSLRQMSSITFTGHAWTSRASPHVQSLGDNLMH